MLVSMFYTHFFHANVQLHRLRKWFIIKNNWYLLSYCGFSVQTNEKNKEMNGNNNENTGIWFHSISILIGKITRQTFDSRKKLNKIREREREKNERIDSTKYCDDNKSKTIVTARRMCSWSTHLEGIYFEKIKI